MQIEIFQTMLSEILIKYSSLFLNKVNKESIRLFLESSPQYPNLLSVVQTLQYASLKVQVGQCDWDYLKNLKSPFLLHVKMKSQERLIISKWDNKFNVLKVFNTKNGIWETTGRECLDRLWNGVVIYTKANTIRSYYLKDKMLLILFIVIFVFIANVIFKQWDIHFLYILPVIIGLLVSLCTYWQSNIYKINIVEKICHSLSITDCEAVKKSSSGFLKKLNMSSMALSFFISQLICIVISVVLDINNILYCLYIVPAILFTPLTYYSVYNQIRIRKICPLCLMILICVFAEALVFICVPMSTSKLLRGLILWGLVNTCILGILYFYSHIHLTQQEQLKTKIQLLKLKREKRIILLESSPIELIKSPMWFGKEKASINITTIISPSCQHCRKVVFELLTLIEKGIDFRWNIMLGKIMNEDSQKIEMWVQEYISDKNKFLKSLHLWSNERTRCLHYSLNSVNQDIRVSEICYDFEYKMKKLNVLGFPQIVLNDRLLSTIYTAKDLEFIIADLSQ